MRRRPRNGTVRAAHALAFCALLAGSALGNDTATPASLQHRAQGGPFRIPFEKYTLDNGLEVILHRDASLPLVAVNIWYHVGPANEPPGRSGFAHLFEHLMFEGSAHAGREFDRLLESAGATNANGTTSWDRTNYFETVPREHLELALWLESDRMGFMLDALTKERLDIQREVVKNERRQRHENAPYGPSELALYDAVFPKGHPYHGAIIGSLDDLSSATMDDVRAFFDAYYAPSNATLTLAGDFDVATAKRLVQRYFATLRKRPKAPTRRFATPPLERPVRVRIEEPVELGRVALGWITPPAYTRDDVILDVVAQILSGGKASRLYQQLVVKRQLSPEVNAYLDSNQLASLFAVEALTAAGATAEQVESAIDDVVTSLMNDGPSATELARAKTSIRFGVMDGLQRLNGGSGESGRAGTLQRLNHYLADPGALETYVKGVETTTAADVQRAIRTHLGALQRAAVITVSLPPAPHAGSAPPIQGGR